MSERANPFGFMAAGIVAGMVGGLRIAADEIRAEEATRQGPTEHDHHRQRRAEEKRQRKAARRLKGASHEQD